MGSDRYDKNFYEGQRNHSRISASKIIPYVLEMIAPINIKSVVDFGCGVGGWLAECKICNPSTEVLGLDFGNANPEQFYIDVDREFRKTDLTAKVDLNKKFDLALSVECAEHLNEKYANVLIDNMCRHSDIIIFGAAIPGQGGVEHVNEQLQSYWVEKFKHRKYDCYDIIRPYFWEDNDIESWYRQDTFVFIKNTVDISRCKLCNYSGNMPLNVASPELIKLLRAEITASEKHLINRKFIKRKLRI